MSVTTTKWAWLKSLGDALVTAGHFGKVEFGRNPESIEAGAFASILSLRPLRAREEKAARRDPPTWFGIFEITVMQRQQYKSPEEGWDPFIGNGSIPGYGALIDLVKDQVDANLTDCDWRWGDVTYPSFGNGELQGARVELTMQSVVSPTNRAEGLAPAVSIPSGLSVGGIQGGELIYWDADGGGSWKALTGSLAEVQPSGASLSVYSILVGVRSAAAGGGGPGDIWLADDGTLRYRVGSTDYKLTGTPV